VYSLSNDYLIIAFMFRTWLWL